MQYLVCLCFSLAVAKKGHKTVRRQVQNPKAQAHKQF